MIKILLRTLFSFAFLFLGCGESSQQAKVSSSQVTNNKLYSETDVTCPEMGRGDRMVESGDYIGAISEYSKVLKKFPKSYRALYNRGTVHTILGSNELAIQDLTEAVRINPNFAKAFNNRGYAKDNLGDKIGALSDFSKAIELDDKDSYSEAYYNRALTRYSLGKKKQACEDVMMARSLGYKIDLDFLAATCN